MTAHEKCNKRRRDAKCLGPSILLDKKDRSEGSLRNSSTYSRPLAGKDSYAQILSGKPTGAIREPTYDQYVLERGTVLKQYIVSLIIYLKLIRESTITPVTRRCRL